MLRFVRRHRVLFSGVLLMLTLFFMSGCHVYKKSRIDAVNTVDMFQLYMVDEASPATNAWRIYPEVVRQTVVTGHIIRLTPSEAKKVAKGDPQLEAGRKNLQISVFYVNSEFAQSLIKSNAAMVELPFDQVKQTKVYEYAPGSSNGLSFLGGTSLAPVFLIIVLAVACGCPQVYADNPGEMQAEGQVFSGAVHSALERHDWLPLRQLRPQNGVYRLKVANEDPETQYINQLELISVDHPAGTTILYDKYGTLHTITQPEPPVTATDLEGREVHSRVLHADGDRFIGNAPNTNPRAEDGLLLQFRRPAGATKAKLIVRANTSPWLAYSHRQLQNSLGQYGPMIRRKMMEKDSAAVQGWTLRQNIPLSVWLETAPGRWERVDFFNPISSNGPKQEVLSIDLSKATGDQVRLKLAYGFHFWEIDRVAMDFSADLPLQPRVLPLSAATDQHGRDLKALLLDNDARYYVQTQTGDAALLQFPAPPPAADTERSLLLHARGYYRIQYQPVAGKPGARYLRQFKQADAFPRFARDQWNTTMRRDTIWTAPFQE